MHRTRHSSTHIHSCSHHDANTGKIYNAYCASIFVYIPDNISECLLLYVCCLLCAFGAYTSMWMFIMQLFVVHICSSAIHSHLHVQPFIYIYIYTSIYTILSLCVCRCARVCLNVCALFSLSFLRKTKIIPFKSNYMFVFCILYSFFNVFIFHSFVLR